MTQTVSKLKAQLWTGSAWVDAPGDAANGLKVQGPLTDTQLRASAVPVSGPLTDAQLRASAVPMSMASQTPDVTDRAARLLGHVTVDSAPSTAVTGPLTDTQLRASAVPVSGPLTDTQLRASAVPVSMASQTPDVTDRAAREAGRVRIWDGADEATVIPLRTQPATTEKTIPTFDLPGRLPTYGVTIVTQTPAITVGVKNLLDIWHPSTVTQDIFIVELWATCLVTTASTAGRTAIRVSTISAAPTGGTNLTSADLGGAGASALGTAGNLMQVKTGGGTVVSTFIRRLAEFPTNPIGRIDIPIFAASNPGNGIILRGGANAGICVDIEREVAHTALVDVWTVGARWLEL
jgi:hypothetical protein